MTEIEHVFSLFDLAAILLTLSAIFGWLNYKFLPLPHTRS
jgi:CPA1 family monovalent cation:H+ antiporter